MKPRLALSHRALLSAYVVATLGAFPALSHAQVTTGFNQTGAGPFDYNTTGNWLGGTINGLWSSDLTLSAAQAVTFGGNTALTTGLTFNHGGNFALTLRGDGVANRTITLGGDISVATTGGTTANVTLGSGTTNQALNVNLGGAVRTMSVAADRTLTFTNVVSSGGIIKTGEGTLGLIGANTFSGGLTLNAGTISFGNGGAWGATANTFTINGGSITSGANRVNSNNNAQIWNGDFAQTGSFTMNLGTGAVTMNGNRTVTVASTLTVGGAISDNGNGNSLTKAGPGTMVLNGANTYSGGTSVTGGNLTVGAAGTLGANVTGNDVTMANGSLLVLGSATSLGSNQKLTVGSSATTLGGVALASNALPWQSLTQVGADPILIGINTAGFNAIASQAAIGNGNSYLGSTTSGTLANTTLGAGANNTYRLGGGGGTLTVTNGVLAGANNLVVGSALINGGGTVVLQGANALTGSTLVNTGSSLNLVGATGALAASAITANAGTALTFDSSTSGVTGTTRAASVNLKGASLNVLGNTTAHSNETITGALTIGAPTTAAVGPGANTVTLTAQSGANTRLTADSLVRADQGAVFFRGTNLGVNTIASNTAGSSNIVFTGTAPTLVGGGGAAGSQTISILPWAVGSSSASGNPTSFVTYDANGIRLLSAGEYATTITADTTANNVRLDATSLTTNGATLLTVNGAATVNSLFLTNGATSTSGQSTTILAGTGALTVTSGAIYMDFANGGNNNATNISKQINFGTTQGSIGTMGTSQSKTLVFSGGITGSGGVMIYDAGNTSSTQAGVNFGATSYTGDTIINGSLIATNTNSLPNFTNASRTGNVYVNGTLGLTTTTARMNGLFGNGRITTPFSSNGGLIVGDGDATSTFSGTITQGSGSLSLTKVGTGTLNLTGTASNYAGATAVQNGTLSVVTLNSVATPNTSSSLGRPITVANGTIGLGATSTTGRIRVTGTGETTDRVINLAGTTGGGAIEQAGTGLLRFTSDFTATGGGAKTLTLTGSTAGIGEIVGAIVDNSASNRTSLAKDGTGTWILSGANTYTGTTAISAGTLALGGSERIANASNLVMAGGRFETRGFSETLGTLTLTASSVIDLGNGASLLAFADSSASTWNNSVTLSFVNYNEATDSIRFGNSSSGLTGGQLSQITINGFTASIDADGYLVASVIPEPASFALLAGAGFLGLAVLRRKRRA